MPKNNTDRILKENLILEILPLFENILGISHIKSSKVIPVKLQDTLEREPDFLRIVETENDQRFILHIEFQVKDEKEMIYRMGEYHSILLKKYKLPIKQFVIYLGYNKPKMRTHLNEEEIFTGFKLNNLQEYSANKLTRSEIPEEIILAVLGNFENRAPEIVVKDIINRLKETSINAENLNKYIYQLGMLSRLRKLESLTQETAKDMGLTIDIEQDHFFKQGEKKGEKKGMEKTKKSVVVRLLKLKEFTNEKIAGMVGVSVNFVNKVQEEMKK